MPLNTTFEQLSQPQRHVLVVRLIGELNCETAEQFKSAMPVHKSETFLIDLALVSEIDRAGVSALYSPLGRLGHEHYKLLHCPERVETALRTADLWCLFEVFKDRMTALDSFGPADRRRPPPVRRYAHPLPLRDEFLVVLSYRGLKSDTARILMSFGCPRAGGDPCAHHQRCVSGVVKLLGIEHWDQGLPDFPNTLIYVGSVEAAIRLNLGHDAQ
jgi:anti-anti-sigma regulatory factor